MATERRIEYNFMQFMMDKISVACCDFESRKRKIRTRVGLQYVKKLILPSIENGYRWRLMMAHTAISFVWEKGKTNEYCIAHRKNTLAIQVLGQNFRSTYLQNIGRGSPKDELQSLVHNYKTTTIISIYVFTTRWKLVPNVVRHFIARIFRKSNKSRTDRNYKGKEKNLECFVTKKSAARFMKSIKNDYNCTYDDQIIIDKTTTKLNGARAIMKNRDDYTSFLKKTG